MGQLSEVAFGDEILDRRRIWATLITGNILTFFSHVTLPIPFDMGGIIVNARLLKQ